MVLSRRGVRAAIWLIALAAVLRTLVWIVALPPWQGPDEGAHYSYIERIAVKHSIPPLARSENDVFSIAIDASTASNAFEAYQIREGLRPLRRDMNIYPPERSGLSGASTGTLDTADYPPAYYLLGTVAYVLPGLHNATGRLYAIRVVSALLGGLAAFLVFRLLLAAGVPDLLSLLGTAAFTQLPMFTQSSAIANPDILLSVAIAGLAAALLRARTDPTRRRLLFVFLWGLLTALSKPIGAPSAVVIAVAMLGLAAYGSSWRRRGVVAGALALIFLAFAGLRLPAGHGPLSSARYGLSYLWQFYLPRLSFMHPGAYANVPELPSWSVWIRSTVGTFGWLSAPLPDWAYTMSFWVLLLATAAAVVGFVRTRGSDTYAAAALVVGALAYVLLLHLAEILQLLTNGGLLLQGRYLLPVVPLFLAAMFIGLARLGRYGTAVAWVLVAATFVLSVESVDTVLVFFG